MDPMNRHRVPLSPSACPDPIGDGERDQGRGVPFIGRRIQTEAGAFRLTSAATSRRRSAFTLVELLLVLVILGILAAIVIPRFAGRSEQAKEQAAVTQISSLTTALNNFEVDNGYYPKSLNDLLVQPRDAQNWHGPYLQSDVIPKDPWGSDYTYKVPGSHNPSSFDLSSSGPPGGDKVFANWTIKK